MRKVLKGLGTGFTYGVPLLAAAVSLAPFVFLAVLSLEHRVLLSGNPLSWIPTEPTLSTYVEVMQSSGFATWFFNSLVVSAAVTLLVLLLQSMAGYAFAKKAFPGRDSIFVGVLAGMMVPGAVVLIPTFLIARELHLLNTYGGLIIPPVAFPLGVFLLRQFIRSIPTEILYAARIDGAGEFAIYWRIILPLSAPALATLAIITFMGQWQSLVWPLLVASDDAMKTLPVGLASFTTQFSRDYGVQMAGAFLSVLPLLVAFLFMQRYFVRGLTASAVKG